MLTKSKSPDYRMVKSYGGEIGELIVIYININNHPLNTLWTKLEETFPGRISGIYIGNSKKDVINNNIEKLSKVAELNQAELHQIINETFEWKNKKITKTEFDLILNNIHSENENQKNANLSGIKIISFIVPDDVINNTSITDIWIQDYFLCMQNTNASTPFSPKWKIYFDNTDPLRQSVATYISEKSPRNFAGLVYSPFVEMEGGNMVFGDNFVITNADVLLWNLERNKDITINQLRQEIAKELRIEHVIFADEHWSEGYGGFTIPDEIRQLHTDMYISLGHTTNDVQYVFVAELNDDDYTLENEYTIDDSFPPRSSMRDTYEQIKEYFNTVADSNLKTIHNKFPNLKPFEVIRVPAILCYEDIFTNPRSRFYQLGKWRLRSFNNCICEIKDGNKIIYLPKYNGNSNKNSNKVNYATVDKRMKDTYRMYFDIIVDIDAPNEFDSIALDGGSLNCITKILYRKP